MARDLFHLEWDEIELMLEREISDRIKAYKKMVYFIVDESTLLVKVQADDCLTFNVWLRLVGDRFTVTKVE